MKRPVIIVGGGMAGLHAARRLGNRPDVSVTLIDPREAQQSLPLLPDVLGRAVPEDLLQYPLERAARRWGFEHVREEVAAVDPGSMTVRTASGARFQAEAILLACGCSPVECPFPDVGSLHVLKDVASAAALRRAFLEDERRSWVVAGGGYTGVEAATHLWRCAQMARLDRKIFLVERGDRLCGTMSAAFSEYIERNVTWLGIELMLGSRVVGVRDGDLLLNDDRRVRQAGLVWSAGVRGQGFLQTMEEPMTPSGRLNVNPFLQVERHERLFAAGDAAAFPDAHGRPLRQSVQAAVLQGAHAARNLLAQLDGRPLRPYRHLDLGYVVPMANGRGCGVALGAPVYGLLPLLLHAVMGTYRSFGRGRSPVLLWHLLRRLRLKS